MRTEPSTRTLLAPIMGMGTAMSLYLLLRPYGDASGNPDESAAAFASPWWLVSHLFGMLAIAQLGRLSLRLDDLAVASGERSWSTRSGRTLALVGMALSLPYYGVEAFGLHVVGRAHLANPGAGAILLAEQIRSQPAALAVFGLGLLALAAAAVLVGINWSRLGGGAWAWPLAVVLALFAPQFALPPAGRVAYGLLIAGLAALWLVGAAVRRRRAAAEAADRLAMA